MPEAIVLLHGFTQTGASWAPVIAELGARYRDAGVLAPDARGHGAAAARRPVDFDACVSEVSALAPRRFTLVGYSMGGRLALHVALAHPDRVDRLVLIGATAGIVDPVRRARRRAADLALADRLDREPIEAFARRWAAQPLFAGQPPAVAAAAHADRLRNTPSGLAASLRGIGTGAMAPLWERLGELAMPVAVLAGERDAKFRAIGADLAARIPAASFAVVPGAGHAVQLESPAFVAERVRDETGGAS